MRKKAAPKTIAHEPIKLTTKGVVPRKLGRGMREAQDFTKSGLTLAKAKKLADTLKGLKWAKVRLDARKTYTVHAKLNLVNAAIFNAEQNYILLTTTPTSFGEASVVYKAYKEGDHFLVRFFVDVISNGTKFRISTFNGSPPQEVTLSAGTHELPVVAQAAFVGDHAVQLLCITDNKAYYLQAIEVQPIEV
jgi:hypothetical protein